MHGDLCSIAEVQAFLQTPDGETEQDPIVQTLISSLSKAIARYCNREFVKPDPDEPETRRLELDVTQPWLDLAPYDLRELTSVTIDPEVSGGTVLTEHDDYRLWPRPNPDGVYTALRFVSLPASVIAGGHWRLVDVTGSWGFSEIPADVKQFAILAVAIYIRREVSAFAASFSVDEGRLERPEALPSAVRAGLASYMRQTCV